MSDGLKSYEENGWPVVTLEEVCTKIQDGAHNSPKVQFNEGGTGRFLYITSKNIRNNFIDLSNISYVEQAFHEQIYPRCTPEIGDVLLTKDGANTGNVTLNTISEPFSLLSSVALIKTKPSILMPEFLKYYLQSPDGLSRLTGQMTGTAIKRIILRELKAATIPLPPKGEQGRIVAILDEAFEGIATAKANAEKNLQNARDIFEHHLEAVFNRNESGWVRKSVSQLAGHSLGKMLDKQKNRGELKPYLRNLNVRWFDFDLSDVSEMRFLPDESDKYRVSAGDVVVCEGGYPGRAAIWSEDTPMYFQKALHRVRFHEPSHSKWFVFYLYSQSGSGRLRQHFTGSGIQHFTGAALGRFVLPIAPKKQTIELLRVMIDLQDQVRILEGVYQNKLASLEALKQSLLHQAFTGKL